MSSDHWLPPPESAVSILGLPDWVHSQGVCVLRIGRRNPLTLGRLVIRTDPRFIPSEAFLLRKQYLDFEDDRYCHLLTVPFLLAGLLTCSSGKAVGS